MRNCELTWERRAPPHVTHRTQEGTELQGSRQALKNTTPALLCRLPGQSHTALHGTMTRIIRTRSPITDAPLSASPQTLGQLLHVKNLGPYIRPESPPCCWHLRSQTCVVWYKIQKCPYRCIQKEMKQLLH